MELLGVSLILLVLLPLSDACIPTKTPEPGIPAMPTTTENPNKCPALTKMTVAECMVAVLPMNLMCAEVMATPTSVSCAVAGALLFFKTGPGSSQGLTGPLTCKGTMWTLPNGMPLAANLVTSPVACTKFPGGK